MPAGLDESTLKYDDIINEVFRMIDPYAGKIPNILAEKTKAMSPPYSGMEGSDLTARQKDDIKKRGKTSASCVLRFFAFE